MSRLWIYAPLCALLIAGLKSGVAGQFQLTASVDAVDIIPSFAVGSGSVSSSDGKSFEILNISNGQYRLNIVPITLTAKNIVLYNTKIIRVQSQNGGLHTTSEPLGRLSTIQYKASVHGLAGSFLAFDSAGAPLASNVALPVGMCSGSCRGDLTIKIDLVNS